MAGLESSYEYCRQLLSERLRESAPGRIQILTGPRWIDD